MQIASSLMTPIQWALKACEAIMAKFEPEKLPPDRFHYHQGVFLSGMEKCWRQTGEQKLFDYMKRWVDSQVLEDGSIKKFMSDELDDIQPGVLLFPLYEQTGDERYKKALHTLVPLLKSWPKIRPADSGTRDIIRIKCGWTACIWPDRLPCNLPKHLATANIST